MKSTFRIAIYFCNFVPIDLNIPLSFIQNMSNRFRFFINFQIVTIANFAVADPGFPRQGGNPGGGCANLLFWLIISENLMKLVPHSPGSATVLCCHIYGFLLYTI